MILQETIEKADYTTQAYSGRGMFGRECLGVRLDGDQTAFQFIADLMDFTAPSDEIFDLAIYIKNMKEDSMGLGTIVYFPNVPFRK